MAKSKSSKTDNSINNFEKLLPMLLENGWGEDSLTRTLDNAFCYIGGSYLHLKDYFEMLFKCGDIFVMILEEIKQLAVNEVGFICNSLIARAFSCYLASSRLSMSGQNPESYAIIRALIENVLYAYYLHHNPEIWKVWVDRHSGEESLKKCKKKFQITTIIKDLKTNHATIEKDLAKRYQRCIDYGAHPNERSVFPNISNDGKTLSMQILNPDPVFKKGSIMILIIVCIDVFRLLSRIYVNKIKNPTIGIKITNLENQYKRIASATSSQLRDKIKTKK